MLSQKLGTEMVDFFHQREYIYHDDNSTKDLQVQASSYLKTWLLTCCTWYLFKGYCTVKV